jgi:cell division protein FtsQ
MSPGRPAHLRPRRATRSRRSADHGPAARSPVRPAARPRRQRPPTSEKVAAARRLGRRRLSLIVGALATAAAVGGGFGIAHSPLFSARNIRIIGATHGESAAILAASRLDAHPPLVDVNPSASARAIEGLPWVESARVAVSFPSTVEVRVTERVAVAYVALGRGGALVDSSGRVLAGVATRPPGVVTIKTARAVPRPGQWLSRADRALSAVASVVPASLAGRIADISRSRHLGIVVALVGEPLVIFGSPTNAREKFVTLATVLAGVSLARVATIDVRAPSNPVLTP